MNVLVHQQTSTVYTFSGYLQATNNKCCVRHRVEWARLLGPHENE